MAVGIPNQVDLNLVILAVLTGPGQLGCDGALGPAGILGDGVDRCSLLVPLEPAAPLGGRDCSTLRH